MTNEIIEYADSIEIDKIEIVTTDDRIKAGAIFRHIRGLEKKLDEKYDDNIKKSHLLHKSLKAEKNKYTDVLESMKNKLNSKIVEWESAQEQKRLEEQSLAINEAVMESHATGTFIEPVIVHDIMPKIKGEYIKETWKAEVFDLMALCKMIVNGKAPLSFIEANLSNLNKQASASNDTMPFDGVRFYVTKSFVTREAK